MIISPPPFVIDRWRADSIAAVTDPLTPTSRLAWAWAFLRQWGVR